MSKHRPESIRLLNRDLNAGIPQRIERGGCVKWPGLGVG
jgi:hypothetical protein